GPAPAAAHPGPVVAAAGRLARGKRFDLLIEAFREVAARHPDWRLRIYGGGAERARLAELVERLGLRDAVRLMGPCTPIEPEFARASIVASASDAESFGMTLVEAMRCGVPVVSTDCPLGPAEIVEDGATGRLVPPGDSGALAAALLELIEDEPLRRSMAAAARERSRAYDPAPIALRYERLFEDLEASRAARSRQRRAARVRSAALAVPRRLLAPLGRSGRPTSRGTPEQGGGR
ncbi:glycosyltransferase, partial [Streptomyces boncukensis]